MVDRRAGSYDAADAGLVVSDGRVAHRKLACLVLWFAGKRSFRSLLAKRTVVIGSTPFLREMSAYFANRTDTGFDLVGTFDSANEVDRDSATPFIGGMGNLRHWCVRHRIRTVMIENAPTNPAAAERILSLLDGLAADIRLADRALHPG